MTQTLTPRETNPAASKLRADARQARRTAIGLAVKLVEGKKVSDAELTAARQAADMSASEFAQLVDRLTARKAAAEAVEARDFDAEREDSLARRRQLQADLDAVAAKYEPLQAESKRIREALDIELKQPAELDRQERQVRDAYRKVIHETGGGDDWRDVQ